MLSLIDTKLGQVNLLQPLTTVCSTQIRLSCSNNILQGALECCRQTGLKTIVSDLERFLKVIPVIIYFSNLESCIRIMKV